MSHTGWWFPFPKIVPYFSAHHPHMLENPGNLKTHGWLKSPNSRNIEQSSMFSHAWQIATGIVFVWQSVHQELQSPTPNAALIAAAGAAAAGNGAEVPGSSRNLGSTLHCSMDWWENLQETSRNHRFPMKIMGLSCECSRKPIH